jgi:hypothetical protein
MEAWLLLVGALAGVVSGLLGVGGGIVLTPFLHYVMDQPWSEAVALSLFVIAVQAPIGVWRHARKGHVDWRLGLLLAAGGAGGVWLGAWLLPRLPVPGLKLLFALLMAFAAWRLASPQRGSPIATATMPAAVAVGFGAGVVSRILGVGGGILTVPSMALLGISVHTAVASSLVAVFSNAALATGANLATGLAWQAGILLAVGAVAGTVLGARIAHSLPAQHLRRVVAGTLVLVGSLVAFDGVRNLL